MGAASPLATLRSMNPFIRATKRVYKTSMAIGALSCRRLHAVKDNAKLLCGDCFLFLCAIHGVVQEFTFSYERG